jgi:pseudouridine-5'-phosphate glycosidase
MAELSGGRSLDLNVDLVVNNARIAARVAKAAG